jgi:hypothetical protein
MRWMILIVYLLSAVANAADDELAAELNAICLKTDCYLPEAIVLNLEDGETIEIPMEYPVPIVQGGLVTLFPGKSLYLSAEIVEGDLRHFKVIDEPQEKHRVLYFRMYQEAGSADTFLVFTNYFDETVKYRALMMLPDSAQPFPTSSCPGLGGGDTVYEHWPMPLFQLFLTEFYILDPDGDELVCE